MAQTNGHAAAGPRREVRTLGYIGLGNAGYHLAKRLATNLSAPAPLERILLADADMSRAQMLADELNKLANGSEDGKHCAKAEIGTKDNWAQCDALVTMLPNGDIVRDVLFGKDSLAKLLRSGTVIVDTSSADPSNTVEMERELREKHGLYLVDSGLTQYRDHAISDGEVTYLVGGQDDAFEAALPVIKAMSRYVFRMGGPGTGHIAKTLNNYVSAANIAALLDAYVLGTKMGIDPLALNHSFNVGTAQNFSTKYSMMRDGLSGDHKSGYNLALLVKDLRINERVFDSAFEDASAHDGYPAHVRRRFEDALKLLGDDPAACHTKSLRAWEQQAGLKVKEYNDITVGTQGD